MKDNLVSSSVLFRRVCGLTTRTASLTVAIADLLISALNLIIMILVMHMLGEYVSLMLNLALWSVLIWMVVRSVLTLVASLILIIGVLKERRLLMLPWLLVSAVSIGGWTVSAIVLPLGLASMDSASQGEGDGFGPLFILVVGIIMSMVVVVGTFMFLTPLSHYQVLSSLESLRHGIEAKSEGFRNANNGHDPTMIPLTDMEHA